MPRTENVTPRRILMKNRKLKFTAIPSLYLNGTCELENAIEISKDSRTKMNLTGKTLNTNKELINAKMIFCLTCGDRFDQLKDLSSHIETNLVCRTKDNQNYLSKSKETKYKQCAMC